MLSAFSSFFSFLSRYKIQLLAKQALVNQIEETDVTEWEKNSTNLQHSKIKTKHRNRAIQNPKSEGFRPTISASITGNYS